MWREPKVLEGLRKSQTEKQPFRKYGTVQANSRDNNRQTCILLAPMADVLL